MMTWWALAALVIGAASGSLVARHGALQTSPREGSSPGADLTSQAPGTPQIRSAPAECAAEREQLIGSCTDLAGRLRDRQPALYTVLIRDLQAIGVAMQIPDGDVFDAGKHNPVGTEETDDPSQHLRVAATMRLGYTDHGAAVRAPEVIVYRCEEAAHAI
jgi:hypothetical protein